MGARTYNFDGLPGPTHGYAGLSEGNLASMRHRGVAANPRAAALQGLDKMRRVVEIGGAQGLLPPHPRPAVKWLRQLGFSGDDTAILHRCLKEAPELLRASASASAMWTANAATVAPSSDTADGRVHLTVANLGAMMHRSLEARTTQAVLDRLFADEAHFVVHPPLPSTPFFFDEGAANHTRLETAAGSVHLFAWGRGRSSPPGLAPQRFFARQGEEASYAVARLHRLTRSEAWFWQQSPSGIDAGAFHTDVLAVGEGAFFMAHEAAFVDQQAHLSTLRARLGPELDLVVARERDLPLTDAVASYPFNSQLIEQESRKLVLLAPQEAWESPSSRAFLDHVVSTSTLVERAEFIDVNASMKNGGGPACLRLRVRLTEQESAAISGRVLYDTYLDEKLRSWVLRHYRDRLSFEDLADPLLLREVHTALDELTQILEIGPVYSFQKSGADL